MTEASYENPKYPDVRKKIACVVSAFIPEGLVKSYPQWDEDKLDTIQRTIAAHRHFKPGVEYDLIIVDNGSPDPRGAAFLYEQASMRRQNFGYGFGGWRDAWIQLGDFYSFFLFTEDDIAPSQDGWLLSILQKFFERHNTGAVGSFVEGRSKREAMSDVMWKILEHGDREMMYNFDGAFTFTSSDILRQVDEHGGIQVFPCPPYSPTVNELAFVNRILELGYHIVSFDDGEHTLVHGSEVFTGDLHRRYKKLCPLININARRTVPEVAKAFSWYGKKS